MLSKLDEARNIINEVDSQMAELFVKRMRAAELVYEYKKELGLPILDEKREDAVIKKNAALISDPVLKGYYIDYIKNLMSLSKAYQYHMQSGLKVAYGGVEGSFAHIAAGRIFPDSNRESHCDFKSAYDCVVNGEAGEAVLPIENSYDVIVKRGSLSCAGEFLNLNRRVLIVTDSGVPSVYAETIAKQCKEPVIYLVQSGEESKSLEEFGALLQMMLEHNFSRRDCVVAVGGGVVGDLSGFAASAYMRGIDFYNIPTTLLSQIDSSIGGKTAINFGNVKNIVGAFYQPKKVLIDPDVLKTLPKRQIANGLAEAIKMALTSDRKLFDILENENIEEAMDEIIIRSLNIKKRVVEEDEKEAGLRKILNFGHTLGHGIELSSNLYHGESVALGMLPMCDEAIRPRVIAVLKKCNLYQRIAFDWDLITKAAFHDKKADGEFVTVTTLSDVGSYEMKTMKCDEVIALAKKCFEGWF